MIGAERLTAHFAEKLNAEWRAGRRGEDVLLEAHAAYGRNHAEIVFLDAIGTLFGLNEAENSAKAAAAQLSTVSKVNSFFFGDSRDLTFDDRCRAAALQGFWSRLTDLRLGLEAHR